MIKVDTSGASGRIKSMQKALESPAFIRAFERELALEQTRINERTQGGRDKDNKRFQGYTKAYAAYRRKRGRNGSTVSLLFSGNMLRALGWKSQRVGDTLRGELFISPNEANKARGHIKGDRLPKRDFLGFSREFIKRINKLVKDYLNGRK